MGIGALLAAPHLFAQSVAQAQAQLQPQPVPPQFHTYFGPVKTDPAIEWLERIAKSAREIPFSGVFVHQTAERSNTTRITHIVDKQGVEHEKIELLDGPLTEIIRRNDEMICYQPAMKTIKVDRRATGRFFPALINGNAKTVAENYRVRLGPVDRMVGYDCQWVILEPKDAMRYLHKLCADLGTGLLLRAQMFNDRNQLIEQFMFTQLDTSKNAARAPLKSRYEKLAGWQTEVAVQPPKEAESRWQVANLPAGFRKIMEMTRNLVGRQTPVSHMVYSDGVLNVSVFVESVSVSSVNSGATPMSSEDGPTSFAMRAVADGQVTVMGEVPLAAVQAIADGVIRRR